MDPDRPLTSSIRIAAWSFARGNQKLADALLGAIQDQTGVVSMRAMARKCEMDDETFRRCFMAFRETLRTGLEQQGIGPEEFISMLQEETGG